MTISEPNDALVNRGPDGRGLYRAVWRWHFYAGLFAVPFMLMLSTTGIIYLFKPQLDALMYRDLMYVSPRAVAHPADHQMSQVLAAYPGAAVRAFTPAPDRDRSSKFDICTADGRELFAFVDPYGPRVLGDYDAFNNLQNYAVLLHGELMMGRFGDTLIELAACWALVLVVTGLFLWFPRTGSAIRGTLMPRLLSRNRRVFWRDVHSVTGFYGSLILVFMLFTGLFWTGFWGERFASVWSSFPKERAAGNFTSDETTGSLNTTSQKRVAWAVEPMPLPESGHAGHDGHASAAPAEAPQGGIGLEVVDAIARTNDVMAGYSIVFPQTETGVFTITAQLGDPYRQRTIHVDRFSGAILADVGWEDYGAVPKAVTAGIALHEGRAFGIVNQMLMLFAALAVLVLSFTGTIMWWRRRPAGRLGVPPPPENLGRWNLSVVLIAVMGIAFPFVGVSLLFVLAFDRLVVERFPRLKAALG